jgi:hypothetical protein
LGPTRTHNQSGAIALGQSADPRNLQNLFAHDFSDNTIASSFLKHFASMARVEISNEQAR